MIIIYISSYNFFLRSAMAMLEKIHEYFDTVTALKRVFGADGGISFTRWQSNSSTTVMCERCRKDAQNDVVGAAQHFLVKFI